jgi:hypothetical protein
MILAVAIKLVMLSGVTPGVILPNAAAPILALPTFLFYLFFILFFYLFYFYFLSFFKFLFPLFFNV